MASCAGAALVALTLGAAAPASAALPGTTLYGYVVTGSSYTSVTGDWNVPTVGCTSGTTGTSPWIGLDGYTSATVEQTGTTTACSGGTASYYAWYEFYPAAPVVFSNTVKPGDRIVASVTSGGSGAFTVKVSDKTQGWAQTVHGHVSGADLSSAEAFVQDPNCTDFGAVHFTGVTVNGSPLGSLSPVKVAGSCDVTISAVSGSSFTVSSPGAPAAS